MPVYRKVLVHTVTVQESIKGAWMHSVEGLYENYRDGEGAESFISIYFLKQGPS